VGVLGGDVSQPATAKAHKLATSNNFKAQSPNSDNSDYCVFCESAILSANAKFSQSTVRIVSFTFIGVRAWIPFYKVAEQNGAALFGPRAFAFLAAVSLASITLGKVTGAAT
jgi:hypothetical protein